MDRTNGAQLYEWFANDADEADVAKLDIKDVTQQIREIRAGDCNIPMSDWEIAVAIKAYAQGCVLARAYVDRDAAGD